jgi:hypothetical protein
MNAIILSLKRLWQGWKRKLWWMIPMVVVLLAFGLLLILAQSSAIAPFIYTLF